MALPNEEQLARLTEQVNEEFRRLGHVTPETSRAMMEAQTQIANFNFKVELGTKFLGKLADAAISTQKAMYKGEKGASAFNKSIDDMSDAAQIAAVGLSLLIPGGPLMKAAVAGITYLATSAMKAGAELTKTANEQSDTLYNAFQKLSKAGAAGSDGMTGVFGDIQKLGLGIQDLDGYISLINDSSRDLALFGGSVTSGRKAFADMNSEMKPFTEQLYNAGLNQEDIAKGAMSYLKIQTQLGAAQTQTTKQLADGAKKYLIEQDALTKLTGMNRADAEAAREAAMGEQRFRAKIEAMRRSGDPKQIAAAEELFKANQILESQSKEAAQGFRDLSTGMITTDAAQKALVSSNGEALAQATEIADGNATAIQGVEKMGKAFGKFAEDMNATAQAGVFEDFSIKFGDAVKLGIFASKNLEAEYEKINKDLVDQGVTGKKAKDDLQQTQTEIRLVQKEAMQATQSFIQDIVPGATKAMLALAKSANDAAQALAKSQTPSAKEAGKLSGTEADIYTGGAMSEEARGGEVKYASATPGAVAPPAPTPLNAQGKPMSIMEQARASSEAAKANNAQRQTATPPTQPATQPAPAKPATTPLAPPAPTPLNAQGKPMSVMEQARASSETAKANNAQRQTAAPAAAQPVQPAPAAPAPAAPAQPAPAQSAQPAPAQPAPVKAPKGSAARSTPAPAPAAQQPARAQPPAPPVDMPYTSGNPAPAQPATPAQPAKPAQPVSTYSERLLNYIKSTERFTPTAFWDKKQWTNGYGTKAKSPAGGSDDPGPKETVNESTALSRMTDYLQNAVTGVVDYGKKKGYQWTQGQVDALTSFSYNLGIGRLNQITDDGKRSNEEIAAKLLAYNKAVKKDNPREYEELPGLTKRRQEELAMFQAKDGGVFDGPKSGYAATLHGNEAVIPLKDGAVPVSMSQEFNMTATNLADLVNIMKQNVGMQDIMLEVLQEIRRAQNTTADNTGRMVAHASN